MKFKGIKIASSSEFLDNGIHSVCTCMHLCVLCECLCTHSLDESNTQNKMFPLHWICFGHCSLKNPRRIHKCSHNSLTAQTHWHVTKKKEVMDDCVTLSIYLPCHVIIAYLAVFSQGNLFSFPCNYDSDHFWQFKHDSLWMVLPTQKQLILTTFDNSKKTICERSRSNFEKVRTQIAACDYVWSHFMKLRPCTRM